MVPEGWTIKALSDIAAVERGKFSVRPRNDPQYYGGAIPFIQTGDVATSGGRITSYSQTLNERGLAVSRLFPKGTIFITIAANIGNAAIAEFDTACPDSIVAVQPTDDTSVMWLLHVLMLEQPKLDAYASQNAQKNINLETLRPLPILTPPNEEQHRIAAILSTWDMAITQTEKLIEAKRKLKKGLMQQLLPGKQRFPGFRETWLEKKLGEVFRERKETDCPELSLLSVTGDQGVIPHSETGRKDSSAEDKSKYKRITPGDIGYNTMRMWQGVSALSCLEGIVSPAYTICVPTHNIDGSFAAHLFKFPPVVHLFYRYSQGLVGDTLNLKFPHFAQITVDLPPLSEQRKIATVLNSLDREIASLVALSGRIKEQKRGLMQKLLTGQIRVKTTEEITVS